MKQDWINIKDGLPDETDVVLCFTNYGNKILAYIENGLWQDSNQFYSTEYPESITHWMPLPSDPEN
jgi:hypothetical protein